MNQSKSNTKRPKNKRGDADNTSGRLRRKSSKRHNEPAQEERTLAACRNIGEHTDSEDSESEDEEDLEQNNIEDLQEMMVVYDRKMMVKASDAMRAGILKVVRRFVVPHEKFICEGDDLGSFNCPDFTDDSSWYYVALTEGGYSDLSPTELAQVWVTYKNEIRDVFSNHKSYCTMIMKQAFLKGETDVSV